MRSLAASLPAERAHDTLVHSLLPCVVENLRYAADTTLLVNVPALQLQAGKLTVIMGPNGAGKSLLLRLLHGLINPTRGTITWAGRAMSAELRTHQAMVFQKPVLLRRSVVANLEFVLRVRGQDHRRARGILAEAGLDHLARQPARRLSGGEQQRLALVRALACDPQILLLDEPAASLDPSATAAIEDIIRQAHRQGRKVVLVTHDLGQAHRLADEIVFMHRGEIAEHTPARSFFEQPNSDLARRFVNGELVV